MLFRSGQIIDETQDTHEQTVAAGESAEFETYIGSVKEKALGHNPEKASVLLSVVASRVAMQKLGEFDVPEEFFEVVQLTPCRLGNVLQLVSGSFWKTKPDSDKDCRLEARALVQNLTAQHLYEVKLSAEVTDKSGSEITDAGNSHDVKPGDIYVISGSGYAKEKKYKGATISLALRAYIPAASGLCHRAGLEITEADQ